MKNHESSLLPTKAPRKLSNYHFKLEGHYDKEHAKILSDIDNAKKQLEKKRLQADYMRAFIAELDSKLNLIEEFDIDIWSYLIEKAIVNHDGSITFIFNNGKEIRV